jgi:DNA processing protein
VDDGTKASRLTDEQQLDWLQLIRSQNVGPRRGGDAAPQICSRDEAEREIAAARKPRVSYIAIGEASYPHRLQMIDDAPPLVAVRGHTEALAMPLVAVVGSRSAFAARA